MTNHDDNATGFQLHLYQAEFWTAAYGNGELVAQGPRIPDGAWIRLLRQLGAEVDTISVSTAGPPAKANANTDAGPKLRAQFAVTGTDNQWPEREADLVDMIRRREKGLEALRPLQDDVDQLERKLELARQRLKRATDQLVTESD